MKKLIAGLTAVLTLISFSITTANSAGQRFTFKLNGDCVDSGNTGTIEENVTELCRMIVTINPAKPFRVVNLQFKDDDGKWQFANDDYGDKISIKSTASKRVDVEIPTVDEDRVFFDFPSREYRIYIAKVGSLSALASKPFTINYIAEGADGDEAEEVDG